MFIVIVLFVSIFKAIFGDENSLVGVTEIISILVLLTEDLTKKPVKNFIGLVLLSVTLGFCSFIAANNIWLGIFVDFAVLTFIGYVLSTNLTKSLIVPYGLQYLFMLYEPVYGDAFVKRIIALAVSPILIMGINYIVHIKKKKVDMGPDDIVEFEPQDDGYKIIKVFGKDFKVYPIRASYALRVGILTAITGFFMVDILHRFNIKEGRWMAYTVFSLTELYAENCRIRSKQRLHGTILGVVIVIVLFMFIKNSSLRLLIILAAGYLNPFVTSYRDTMIVTTVSAVASEALTKEAILTSIERVIFVILGIILSLIGNRYIFPAPKSPESKN